LIFAIDIGTSRVKAALFNMEGTCLGLEGIDLLASHSKALTEIDAHLWLSAMIRLSERLLTREHRSSLTAIVVSGNGPTILPIDQYGEPLAFALTWLDRRAQKEAEEASRVLKYPLDAAFNLPKILWLRRNLPSLYERTAYFVSCPEFVIGRLTGEWRTCLPNEGYTRIVWDSAAIDSLVLDQDKFPRFSAVGEIVGEVSTIASDIFGFPSHIPVVMGGPDFIASLLGTATVEPGRTCDKGGTSEGINLCSEKSVENMPALLVMPHIIAPYYNISGVISTSGAAVAWFRDTFIATKQYESMYRMASMAKPGAGGLVFLPYLAGERSPHWDPDARALFLGLGLQHGLSEISRAVLEGTAFAMRDVLDSMESAGATVSDMRATGLPSLSPLWNQIKADITGKRVMVSSFSEPELAGCFAIGNWALGEAQSLKEASERIFVASSVYEPCHTTKQLYDELYSIYRQSYRTLAKLFPKLSNLQRRLEEETHE